jgi:tetratricopeptide (TPR) repeat protein
MILPLCVLMMLGRCAYGYIFTQAKADEAIANAEAFVAKHPADAEGYYILGRLHAMAWAYGDTLDLASQGGRGEPPRFVPWDTVEVLPKGFPDERQPGRQPPVRRADRKEASLGDGRHLAAAITNYRKAVQLDPRLAIAQLGLGWILHMAGRNADMLPADFLETPATMPATTRDAIAAAVGNLSDENQTVRDAASQELRTHLPEAVVFFRGYHTADPETLARMGKLIAEYWDLQALPHLRAAYSLTVQDNLKQKSFLQETDAAISLKAGQTLLVILHDYPATAQKNEIDTVDAAVQKLAKIPLLQAF